MEQNARFARLLFAGCGQQLLYHQERQRGLAVAERAVHHLLYRVGKRHPQCRRRTHPSSGLRLSSVQPRRPSRGGCARCRKPGVVSSTVQLGASGPAVQPGFLRSELAAGGADGIGSSSKPHQACPPSNFQRQAANGDAMLADEIHVPVHHPARLALPPRARMATPIPPSRWAVSPLGSAQHANGSNADNLAGVTRLSHPILFSSVSCLFVYHMVKVTHTQNNWMIFRHSDSTRDANKFLRIARKNAAGCVEDCTKLAPLRYIIRMAAGPQRGRCNGRRKPHHEKIRRHKVLAVCCLC